MEKCNENLKKKERKTVPSGQKLLECSDDLCVNTLDGDRKDSPVVLG